MLESKIKKAAFIAAVDIGIKRINKSPKRCARNLMELGVSAFPNKITDKEKDALIEKLLVLCDNGDSQRVKELLYHTFF